MRTLWRRFNRAERLLLLIAVWAAVATVGTFLSGDGWDSAGFVLLISVWCVVWAGSSRKRRLLGSRRPLGPLERAERHHPVMLATASGIVFGALIALTGEWVIGLLYAAFWIALQLAIFSARAARRGVEVEPPSAVAR